MKKRTEELMQLLEKEHNITQILGNCAEEFLVASLAECLDSLLKQYHMKKSDVINRSCLNQIYAYQIFAGSKKPSRDKLIAIIVGFPLLVADGNALLRTAGFSPLHPRNKRDAVVIFGLNHKLSVQEIDDILFALGENTFN